MLFIHPQFNPIAFTLGPLQVHWYGLMYLLAFAMAWFLGRHRIRSGLINLSVNRFEDLLFYAILGVVLGGRLGYVLFYQPGFYFANPQYIPAVWDGGMSFHGGLLGVLLVMFLFARKEKKTFLEIADFAAPLVPLGLAAGRWGNFMNGELWGRPTNADWGMIFPNVDQIIRHPSQLYEMALEGFVLFAILWLFSSKIRPIGQVSALFLIVYGLFRFLIEFTREPDSFLGTLALQLSMGQWLSIPMIFLGLFLFIVSARKVKA